METFLKHIMAIVDSVDEKYDSWFLYKIMQTIQEQCLKFSAACSSGFENFNLDEYMNSWSYENFNEENQEEEMGQVPPDVHTPQPSPFANPSPTLHPPPFATPSARPRTSPFVVPSPTLQPPPFVPSSSTSKPSPYVVPSPTPQPPTFVPSSSTPKPSPYVVPSPTPQPPPFVSSSSTPQPNPDVMVSPKPQVVPFVILSPTPHPPSIVISSPTHDVYSMVGRVTGNPRKRIIPPRLSPYVLGPRSKRPRPNPQYSLTPEEDKILDKFWNGYYKKYVCIICFFKCALLNWTIQMYNERKICKVPELDQICSRISAESLRQCLRKHWIDTNVCRNYDNGLLV